MTSAHANKLRVVLDTNVYFSAFSHPKGPPSRIWRRAVSRSFILLVSRDILREIAGVLREDLKWQEPEIVEQLKLIVKVAEIVSPKITLQVIAEDPTDDRPLECAVAGRADLIVSGDRHLRELKHFQEIGIVQPSDFLRTLG